MITGYSGFRWTSMCKTNKNVRANMVELIHCHLNALTSLTAGANCTMLKQIYLASVRFILDYSGSVFVMASKSDISASKELSHKSIDFEVYRLEEMYLHYINLLLL